MKKLAFVTVLGFVVGLPQLASAGLVDNGVRTNGLADNGVRTNGLVDNGTRLNGVHINSLGGNGFQVNGVVAEGTRPDAPAQEVPDVPQREYVASITLPGGRTLIAQ